MATDNSEQASKCIDVAMKAMEAKDWEKVSHFLSSYFIILRQNDFQKKV